MAWRTEPPFRADHVGSLLRPPELLQARADHAAGTHRRARAARHRGRRHPRRRAHAGGGRPAVGDRRRAAARLLAHGLHLPAGRRREARLGPRRRVQEPRAAPSASRRPRCASTSRCGSSTRSSPTTSSSCATPWGRRCRSSRSRRRAWCITVAAARRSTRPSIPTWSVLGRSHRGLPRGGDAARRAGLPLPAARRHQPRLPQRPGAARAHRASWAATASTSTRPTSATSTRPSRAGPRACGSRRTCAAATSAPRGTPRATTSTSPRCC